MVTLEVGTTYNMTPAEVFNDATMRPQDWQLSPSNVIPGVKVTYAGLSGTPTEAGEWTIYAAQLDDYGDPAGEKAITVTVTAPAGAEPEPAAPSLVLDVLEFLGLPNNADMRKLATQHTRIVTTFVRNYTRGNGFNAEGVPNSDLNDVIITATARYLPNPQQATRQSLGNQSIGYASIEGFTLAEKAVLNRYRKMTNRVNIVTTPKGLTGPTTSYATVEYVDSKVAGIPTTNLDGYATTAYVDNVARSLAVDLNPYATRSYVDVAIDRIPDVDLTPYALKTELPEPVDLTDYATESYVNNAVAAAPEPDLTPYALTTEVPGVVGVKRSAKYTLPQDEVVRVYDVTPSGSVFVMADGDKAPGPLWIQIYRAGNYNSVDKWAGSSNWEIGTTAEPTTGTFRVWVEGQGSNAALCFKATNNWNRAVRVYWMEV